MAYKITNINDLYEMWAKDAPIDKDNPHEAAGNIANIHQKYLSIQTTHELIAFKIKLDYKKEKLWRFKFYKNDPDIEDEEIKARGLEKHFTHPGRDINIYMDADPNLSELLSKIEIHEKIAKYCSEIINQINFGRSKQCGIIMDRLKWEYGR